MESIMSLVTVFIAIAIGHAGNYVPGVNVVGGCGHTWECTDRLRLQGFGGV